MSFTPPLEAAKFALASGNEARAETLYTAISKGKHENEIIAAALFELSKLTEKQARFGEALAAAKRANMFHAKLDYKTAIYKLEQRIEELKKALDKKVEKLKFELKANAESAEDIQKLNGELAEAYQSSDVRIKALEHYHEVRKSIEASIKEAEEEDEEADTSAFTPALIDINNKLGKCYFERSEFDDAIRHYERALEKGDPEAPNIATLTALAWVYYKKGDFEKARDIFEQISALQIAANGKYTLDEIKTRKNIAWCNLELKKRYHAVKEVKRALKTYRRALSRQRIDIADDYMLLGWFYYEYGCHEKRGTYFNKAVDLFQQARTRLAKVLGDGHVKVQQADTWLNELPPAKEKNKRRWTMRFFE